MFAPTVEAVPEDPESDWGVNPNALSDAQAESTADTGQKRRRGLTEADKAKSKIWIAVGLCLHLTAVGLIIAWAAGVFTPAPDPPPKDDTPKKTDPNPKPPRQIYFLRPKHSCDRATFVVRFARPTLRFWWSSAIASSSAWPNIKPTAII